MKILLTGIGTTLAALTLCTAPAGAAVVGENVLDPDALIFAADPGEANRVTLSSSGGFIVFEDANAPVSAQAGCTNATPNRVNCELSSFIIVQLEDGDDEMTVDAASGAAPGNFLGIEGGRGNDVLRAGELGTSLDGGLGQDMLEAGPRTTSVRSIVEDGTGANGIPTLRPDPDQITCQPLDPSLPSYEHRTVQVDTGDTVADACRPIVLYSETEVVQHGTPANDTLFGGNAPTRIFGEAGDDFISSQFELGRADGGDGNDRIEGIGLMLGGAGDDRIQGGFGTERARIDGGDGADYLIGGQGGDSITGGPGVDRFTGRGGNDTIRTRDGIRETVRCGDGRDSVSADRTDNVSRDCEKVSRG